MKKCPIEQSGRSMIEMLGVLAIVGVLSVAGIAGYSKAMAKYKTNKVVDQISSLVANIRTTFAAHGNYKGLSKSSAYKLGIYPEDMVKSCNTDGYNPQCMKNAFGGEVYIKQMEESESSQYASGFVINFAGLSKEACSSILTIDWGSNSGFWGYGTNETSQLKYKTDLMPAALLTIGQIADICKCKENTCSIILGFS